MSDQFKPMLAATVDDIETLNYPLYASPKLDGIRAVVIDGVLLSRNLKPIPNVHVQNLFGKAKYNGFDGELIIGEPGSPTCFRDTSSAVMGREGKPNVEFYVFDAWDLGASSFHDRQQFMADVFAKSKFIPPLVRWPCEKVRTPAELTELEECWLAAGYEGAMLRSHSGPYKFGRSTLREGYLMKLKRFIDGEAEVIGFEEQQHNGNEATKDALGRSKRSSAKAGKVGTGRLGALIVRDLKTGVEFNVGSGFSDTERSRIWIDSRQPTLAAAGKIIKYRYFPTGSKDKPRFPVFLGFRDKIDL